MYGYAAGSVKLRVKCRLRVLENRVLRRIFRPKREEVTATGENCVMRSMEWAGHRAHMGEKRNAHKVLVGKSELCGELGGSPQRG